MTDSAEASSPLSSPTDGVQPAPASAGAPWPASLSAQESAASTADEHPELMVGAAFAGGLLVAIILRRLAR
jgi:hypothetical protein